MKEIWKCQGLILEKNRSGGFAFDLQISSKNDYNVRQYFLNLSKTSAITLFSFLSAREFSIYMALKIDIKPEELQKVLR